MAADIELLFLIKTFLSGCSFLLTEKDNAEKSTKSYTKFGILDIIHPQLHIAPRHTSHLKIEF